MHHDSLQILNGTLSPFQKGAGVVLSPFLLYTEELYVKFCDHSISCERSQLDNSSHGCVWYDWCCSGGFHCYLLIQLYLLFCQLLFLTFVNPFHSVFPNIIHCKSMWELSIREHEIQDTKVRHESRMQDGRKRSKQSCGLKHTLVTRCSPDGPWVRPGWETSSQV